MERYNDTERTSLWVIAGRVVFTVCTHRLHLVHLFQLHGGGNGLHRLQRRVLAWMRIILRRLGQPGLAEHLTMHIVRKLAHFCEYTLEGFLLMLCMRVYSRHPLRHITVPMLGGVLTALTDETIQLFSEGRSSQVTDVWLDSAGVLAGILVAIVLLLACEGLYYHIKRRHE